MHDKARIVSSPRTLDTIGRRLRWLGLALAVALAGPAGTASALATLPDPVVLHGTFVGNSAGSDVKVAPNGDIILVGYTSDPDLPVTNASTIAGGSDLFVARFDSKLRTLIWLIYFGGSYDETARAVAVDSGGNVYVAGETDSSDFPATIGAYDTSTNGYSDGYVAKFNGADGDLLWASYLGGSDHEEVRDIAVDSSYRAVVVGATLSTDFPTVSGGSGDGYRRDGFVTRFSSTGAGLSYSTYLDWGKNDEAFAVDTDSEGAAYVATYRSDYETVESFNSILKFESGLSWDFDLDPALSGYEARVRDIAIKSTGAVVFTGRMNDSLTSENVLLLGQLDASGSALDWTANLENGEGTVIAVNSVDEIWITGVDISEDYPLVYPLFPWGENVVTLLSSSGTTVKFSTRIGGESGDIKAIAVGSDDVPVLGGSVINPASLPLTGLLPEGPYGNAFAARLSIGLLVVGGVPVTGGENGPVSGRFLPRIPVSLPPLERVIEPYPVDGLDLDGDGDLEIFRELPDRSLDLAWGNVVTDRHGDGRRLISVGIGTLDGARVLGVFDHDGDGEPELVVEDPRRDADTVEGWLLDTGDQDVDLLVVGRGGAPGALLVDLDDDGDLEVVASAPHLADGGVAQLNLDPDNFGDTDFDVLLIGGLPRAILDIDGAGELEVVAERGGTSGTISTGSVEVTTDGDTDVLFLVGTYAFSRDLDEDGVPEIVAGDGGTAAGTISVVAPVVFVGGDPMTSADLDLDGEPELVVYDDTAVEGTMDPLDAFDGGDGDPDVVFVGGIFRGALDIDGDRELELVVEDSGGTADTLARSGGLEAPPGDSDTDLVVVRGTGVAAMDVDDDGEIEIVADSASLGAGTTAALDGADQSLGDGDVDVLFVGGSTVAFADFDRDFEIEVVAEDGAASPGSFDPDDGSEASPDADADVVFVAGTWRALRDLDQDGEPEILVEDSGLGSAASGVDGIDLADSDTDVVFIESPFLTLHDLDGDGEPEIVVEDGGVSAPSVVFGDVVEDSPDGDTDLVRIPAAAGWRVADLDSDAETELVLEHSGALAGSLTAVDNIEGLSDGDADVIFLGGIPQILADLDGDSEIELVVSAAITGGTASKYLLLESGLDLDVDVVFVGGTARGFFDVDGDLENEVAVENGAGGASSRIDEIDESPDSDPDLIFTGGRVRHFADLDWDGDVEAIAENSSASPGSSSRYNSADGDSDPDVIYVAGAMRGDFLPGSLDIVVNDPNLAGGTALDPIDWDDDVDADGILIGTDNTAGSPSLAVVAPNGGETVTIGLPLTVTWTASGFAGNVRIELSRDGGSTWETLLANTPNDGSEPWTSDGAATGTALIRVTSRNLVVPASDDSDAVFSLI